MSASPLVTRTLTAEEIPAFVKLVFRAFLEDPAPEDVAAEIDLLEAHRTHGTFDGDELIGGATMLSKRMTLPGTGPHPVAAISCVGVAPDHRRRGAMSQLMRAQLHSQHESGDAFAALYASEGDIYGRFGYGLAGHRASFTVPRGAEFQSTVDVSDARVREVDKETALPLMHHLHSKYAPTRVGWLGRTKASWQAYLSENAADLRSEDLTKWRYAIHPEGYAVYQVKRKWESRKPEHGVNALEILGTTPQAYAALWRYLLDIDLTAAVEADCAVDDPIIHMLKDAGDNARQVRDGLWVRVIDIDRALPLRGYSAPLDVVLAVEDTFCPWNAGTWRLVAEADGQATVTRTDAEPDLALGARELGAVFLGGTTVQELVAAQRIRELTPGSARAASRAFAGDHQPHCPEVF
ncbi:GNAT family N-acetyltransferase [Kutzneria sp. CA-103260]|uniref:GNAT family N-acetyltransferase n=1 Tax=Kutzneria sp. CA-103260 TaxID=2802641 RepID=UPI001BA6598F|nr:GNAT family N-acetyltransferase [Kutzneria sp. CA-103260]QUQ68116.1 GNAT family N-acetyltransferase [Kutzneria sp. CA-103260]